MRCRRTTILLSLLILLACAKEDPNERANALFVEATQLVRDAPSEQSDAAAVTTYRKSLARLDTIVTKYPASNLAVQLASGQLIGDFKKTFQVPSMAMLPTLQEDDFVVVLKYGDRSAPKRGDVVVFLLPKGPGLYIKRLIGLPGERIQMIDGLLYIDGQPVQRERMSEFVNTEMKRGVKRWRETLPNGMSFDTPT